MISVVYSDFAGRVRTRSYMVDNNIKTRHWRKSEQRSKQKDYWVKVFDAASISSCSDVIFVCS